MGDFFLGGGVMGVVGRNVVYMVFRDFKSMWFWSNFDLGRRIYFWDFEFSSG